MRLHCVSLLIAAALLAMVDDSVATIAEMSTTRSINTNSIPTPRLLRGEYTLTEGDEERMIKASSIINFFKPGTSSKVTSKITASVASNVAKEIPDTQAMLRAGVSIRRSFETFGLDKADDLLGNPYFMMWFGYVTQYSQKYKDKATTVVKWLNTRYGDEEFSRILATSMKSDNKRVQTLADGLQIGQMDIWLKTNKYTPKKLAKLLGVTEANRATSIHAPVVERYARHYKAAMDKAAKKAAPAAS